MVREPGIESPIHASRGVRMNQGVIDLQQRAAAWPSGTGIVIQRGISRTPIPGRNQLQ